MPVFALLTTILIRLLAVTFVVAAIILGIAALDYLLGTNVIAVIWQWMARAYQLIIRAVQSALQFLARLAPGYAKRFVLRKGASGFTKIFTSIGLTALVAWLGHDRYQQLINRLTVRKNGAVTAAKSLWKAEIWFLPRWLRAAMFIAAAVLCIIGFIEVQAWAERRHSPMFLGIDPWSLAFGFVASFFLTNLPLMGFDHFLEFVFKPLRRWYMRAIRKKGAVVGLINWLVALRPARRWAELQRMTYMRKARDKARNGDRARAPSTAIDQSAKSVDAQRAG